MGWLGYEGFEKAAMIYRALAYLGYPVAMYNYGNMLAHGRGVKKNIKRAVYWYGKAADQWLVVAMCAKAMFLTNGPEDARDYKTTFELFLRAAESGDETAMYQLGCFYMKGRHVKKDYEKAVQWSGKLWTTATVISRNFNWQDAIMPAEGFPGTRKKPANCCHGQSRTVYRRICIPTGSKKCSTITGWCGDERLLRIREEEVTKGCDVGLGSLGH